MPGVPHYAGESEFLIKEPPISIKGPPEFLSEDPVMQELYAKAAAKTYEKRLPER